MAKLSDVFLALLKGSLEGGAGLTPDVKAQLALQQQESARQTLSTLANLSQNFNPRAPGVAGPLQQGSVTPSPGIASALGIAPGTSYEPISRTATTPFITPGKTPGSAKVGYSSRPLARGEVTEPAINTISPYVGLLGHQLSANTDLFNQYNTDYNSARTRASLAIAKLPSGIGEHLLESIGTSLSLPSQIMGLTQSPQYQAAIQELQQANQDAFTARQNRDAIGKQLNPAAGGAPPATGTGGTNRPPPPPALSNPPPGQIPVWSRSRNAYGFVTQDKFNPLDHEVIQTGNPLATSAVPQ